MIRQWSSISRRMESAGNAASGALWLHREVRAQYSVTKPGLLLGLAYSWGAASGLMQSSPSPAVQQRGPPNSNMTSKSDVPPSPMIRSYRNSALLPE